MSSTGQVVGGIVGAVVGYFVGNPVLGAQIGMTIGGLVDPPKTLGPRLNDLTAQTSTYGAFIPRIYGTAPVVGNIFWIQGNALVEHTADGGGKGGPTVTNFEYFATFAVGLCAGPIAGVRRIWIGGQLWYDAGSDDVSTIIVSNENAANFTLYTGSETQLADPLIQADHGVANVPAYRGLAYIVFSELPLKGYGNSLAAAQVKVEVVNSASSHNFVNSIATVTTETNPRGIVARGNYAYVINWFSQTLQVFNIANPASVNLLGSVGITAYGSPYGIAEQDGYVYTANYGTNRMEIFNVQNPYSPVSVSTIPTNVQPYGIDVSGNYVYVVCQSSNTLQIYKCANKLSPILVGTVSTGSGPRHVKVVGSYAYVVNYVSQTMQVVDVTTPESPVVVGSIAISYQPWGVDVNGGYAYVCSSGLTVIDISNPASPAQVGNVYITGETHSVEVNGNYAYLSSDSHALHIIDISNPASPVAVNAVGPSDANTHTVSYNNNYAYVSSYGASAFYVYFFSGSVIDPAAISLSTIVESECLKSDLLAAADLDVTDLTDQVRGYRVSSLAPLRGGIDPLRKAWPFDAIQHGYKIKFKKRGGASVATITEGELDAREAGASPGVQIANVREMDLVLPKQLTAQYLDATREYDVNVAEESRQ